MPGLLPGKQHPCCQPPCFSGVTLLLCLPGCRAGQDIYRSQDTARAAGALWRLPLVYIVMNIIRTLAIVGEVMHYCWPSPGAPVQPPHDLALPPCLNVELCPSHWLPQSWPLFRPAGCYTAQLPWSAVTVRQGLMCRDPGAELVFFPPCAAFRPLYKVTRRDLDFKDCLFAGLAGLRGSICLILAQAVVTEDSSTIDTEDPSSTASVSSRSTPSVWVAHVPA